MTENPNPTKIGSGMSFDQQIWNDTVDLIQQSGVSQRDVIEDFILYLRRVNLARFFAHFEIFKKTIDTPGCIVECGVFKGVSLLTFTKMVEIFCPGDTLKRVIGFDTFEGFPGLVEEDGPPLPQRDKVPGGFNANSFYPVLQQIVDITQRDSMIPRFKRVELCKGDVRDTIPAYVENNPGLRISLLHLDMDLYEPTLTALKYLYPLVVSGGVVLLDEYAMDSFAGESKAFDEYFSDNRPKLTKFPYISTPGGFFIKNG